MTSGAKKFSWVRSKLGELVTSVRSPKVVWISASIRRCCLSMPLIGAVRLEGVTTISRVLLACYGLYFVAHVWRHLNHAMMIGTGQVGKLVGIQLFESATVAGIGWAALTYGGIEALLASMGVVILALTGSVLPRWVARSLRGD